METGRTEYDIGKIFRYHGQEYEYRYAMFEEQRKALRAIASCRTSVLGGHLHKCLSCGYEEISYNSCRNSNCPKCQGTKRSKWVKAREDELLDTPYFHLIFTIPDYFNSFHISHYRELYNSLFSASSGTILRFFKKLGGVPGITAVAHSWGQNMCIHPHVHMLVTGGCLSFDMKQWKRTRKNYLFNVRELSDEFRKRFIKEIRKRIPEIQIPTDITEAKWVVFSKKPFSSPLVVLKYLGRYVYRTAISNSRITDVSGDIISFTYKDYKTCDSSGIPKIKTMKLNVMEFIRRFLQHIHPSKFRRVRQYGIHAGSNREEKLQAAKRLTTPVYKDHKTETLEPDTESEKLHLCPVCKSTAIRTVDIFPPNGPPHIIFRNEKGGTHHAA